MVSTWTTFEADLDGLSFLADFQRDIEASVLIQLEDDSVLA